MVEDDKDIENTKIFLQVFSMAVERAFMKRRTETSIADLKLEEELKNNPEAERYHKMFDIINLETVEVSTDLLKSMLQIIDNHIQGENKLRKISELKLKYFDAD